MKLAVYAICKDEIKHIKRWYDSIKDGADGIFVTDTGSKDGSVEFLRSLGVHVDEATVFPWRFDLARNLSLMNVPEEYDMCLCLDLDEIMLPNWREELDKVYYPGLNMVRYPYVFNWEDVEQTIPRLSLYQFKIHSRKGYQWFYPIHEILEWMGEGEEQVLICENIRSHHYPDENKPRNYQQLLDVAVNEYPNDQRISHLRGRELFMYGKNEEAIEELLRHLEITKDFIYKQDAEGVAQTRATSMRLIARALFSIRSKTQDKEMTDIITWLLRGASEAPLCRESWIWLAQAWFSVGNYAQAYACAKTGLSIVDKTTSIENEEICWGSYPEELLNNSLKHMIEEGDFNGYKITDN